MDFLKYNQTVFDKNKFVETLENTKHFNFKVFENICCPDPFESKKIFLFPIVVISRKGICPFILFESNTKEGSEQSEIIGYICNVLKDYFSINKKIQNVFILSENPLLRSEMSFETNFINEPKLYIYYKGVYNTTPEPSSQALATKIIADFLKNDSEEQECFNEKEYEEVLLKLSKESNKNVFRNSDLKSFYVRKRDKWYPAFKQDAERTFYLALLGGFLGVHRFYLKMYATGILYAITLGLLGVGWFFDCFEILLGVWCKKGKRLMSLKNRRRHTVEFIIFFFVIFTTVTVFAVL